MNDDQPLGLLAQKRAEHRRLDGEIGAMLASPDADQLEIARLKKRKLKLKDEIQLLADSAIPDIIA
jgi:hypothetical protein